jgi:hypothetical protein
MSCDITGIGHCAALMQIYVQSFDGLKDLEPGHL